MTNEELKKKIEGILQEEIEYVVVCGSSVKNVCIEHIADALIAAGIGDLGETKEKLKKINERILLGDIIACDLSAKCAEYKYRAEVAERALKRFSENIVCEDCPFFQECTLSSKLKAVSYSQKCFGEYLRQAEKELAEERKDE